MNNKSRTSLMSGIIIVALTVIVALLTGTLGSIHVYWILGAELIAVTLSTLSLNSNSGMKFSVLPLMIIYGVVAVLYAVILLLIGGDSERVLHIGECTFLAITAISYLVMNASYGKKNISKY